jgi:glycolate oxidase iron-sulfur subunit
VLVAQRFRLVPRRFGNPRLTVRGLTRRLPALPAGAGDVYLFPGCVMDAWQRDVHVAAVTVMVAVGARPMLPTPGADCCGALHVHAGRETEARRLARRVMAAFPGDAPIVVDSAGCGAAMKDYGRLLATPAAIAFAARVQDFAEWLVTKPAPPTRPTGRVVVVQDPCHLRHVQRAHQHVRTVLATAYELRDTADEGLCCGAGGAYSALEPALASSIRERKVSAIRAAAAGAPVLVVSANPGCAMHLAAVGLDVRHPAELLAAALTEPAIGTAAAGRPR